MFASLTATLTLLRAVQKAELTHDIETLLPQSLSRLADLLDLNHKNYSRLRCDSDTTYIYYSSKTKSSFIHAGRDPESQLFSLVLQTLGASNPNNLSSIIKNGSIKTVSDLLRGILIQGSTQSPMKPEYQTLIHILAELVVFLFSIHQESESRLAKYIESCMELESLFIQKFQSQMNRLISSDDTQKLIQNLDVLVQESHHNDINKVPLEVQEFFEAEDSKVNPEPVVQKFKCSSTYLTRLYQAFLQVRSLGHRTSQEPRDKRKYINILLELFKKHLKTGYLEVDEFSVREIKMDFLYDKFLRQVIPPHLFDEYAKISESIHFFPEENASNFIDLQNSTSDDNEIFSNESLLDSVEDNDNINFGNVNGKLNSINLSLQDQFKLVKLLDILLPQLTDYFEFNLEFPQVMRFYLKYLFGGQYFVEDNDFDFAKQVLSNTNTIVDFENGDTSAAMKIEETIQNLHRIHFYLTPETTADKTLIMRLALVEHLNWIKIGTKYLKHWNYRLLSMLQLHQVEQSYHQENLRKYLSLWYNSFMKNRQFTTIAADYSKQRLIESKMISWVKKSEIISSQYQSAKISYEQRFFDIWVRKLKALQLLNTTSLNFYINKSYSKSWKKLVSYHLKKAQLTATSNTLLKQLSTKKSTMTKRIILNNWALKCSTLDDPKFLELEATYKIFVLKRFFNLWKSNYKLETYLKEVRQSLDVSLQKLFFNQIKNRTRLNALAKDAFSNTNKQIATNVFKHWAALLQRYRTADAFLRKKTLEYNFKNWMLQSKYRIHGVEAKTAEAFNLWVLQNKRRHFSNIQTGLRTKRHFDLWKRKRQEKQLMLEKSNNFSDARCLTLTVTCWRRKLEFEKSLNEVASLNVLKKFLNKVMNYHQLVRALEQKVDPDKKTLADKILLKLSLSLWRDSYNKQFEESMVPLITQFRETVSNDYLVTRIVNRWIEQYNVKQQKVKLMNERCIAFSRQLSLCVNLFTKWQALTNERNVLSSAAINFNNQVLYKRHLMTWYNFFVKVDTLDETAEAFAYRRDLQTARELLNKWSMKNIKARRNQQSCVLFIDRWKAVKARSIFELWLYKVRHRNEDDGNGIDDVADISYMTANQSPLAYKQRFDVREESYLSTPIKKRDRPGAFTPVSKTSPTKLQETTERLRGERMSALIRHYQKARASSRKKSSLFQPTKFTPPGRPVFDRFAVSQPEVESGTETIFNTSPSYEDILTVETAKLLRRITPIFVPTEEEEVAPRFSPVSRLKSKINLNRSPLVESPVYPARYL